jgi:hypothetical protein
VRLTFIHLAVFLAEWKRLGLDDESLRALELAILHSPEAGEAIAGTGGLRKLRFAPPRWRKGKSGAARVCYVYFVRHALVCLVAAYAKNEQENITAVDKVRYRQLIDAIGDEIEGQTP